MISRLGILSTKNPTQTNPEDVLPPGSFAPHFKLASSTGNPVSRSDFRGRPVILAFYPADWSPVCGDQMVLYNEILELFEEHNAQLLGVSVDSVWSHRAFAEAKNLSFPLLADFEPKGEVARLYGAYNEELGICHRALFVIDGDGVIRWSYRSPSNVNPGAHGILKALENLG
jgi:peroxiredoxin